MLTGMLNFSTNLEFRPSLIDTGVPPNLARAEDVSVPATDKICGGDYSRARVSSAAFQYHVRGFFDANTATKNLLVTRISEGLSFSSDAAKETNQRHWSLAGRANGLAFVLTDAIRAAYKWMLFFFPSICNARRLESRTTLLHLTQKITKFQERNVIHFVVAKFLFIAQETVSYSKSETNYILLMQNN